MPDEKMFGEVVIDGRKYPSCRYCGMRLTSFYAGAMHDDQIIRGVIKRYLDHIWNEHPDRVDEVHAMFKKQEG